MATFKNQIIKQLPLSVNDYMALSNDHYYNNRDPLGVTGDFITAPEISQIFGEVICAMMMHVWQKSGSPQNVNLVEYGAGRGTLMKDMMRTARTLPDFEKSLHVHMVESSQALTEMQKQALCHVENEKKWHKSTSFIELDNLFNALILNEFMDALSIEQYVFKNSGWYERTVIEKDGELFFGLSDTPTLGIQVEGQEGDVYECSKTRTECMKNIANMVRENGFAVVVDYGAHEWGVGDTLQALSNHKSVPPLSMAGEADLTSHIDFTALTKVAEEAGCIVQPLITQGFFLNSLGGFIRARDLDQVEAYTRLVSPAEMGELFKVMILSSPNVAPYIAELFPHAHA